MSLILELKGLKSLILLQQQNLKRMFGQKAAKK
jgi:hypothetical protein